MSMNKLSAIDVKLEDILQEIDARAKFAQFLARYFAGKQRNASPRFVLTHCFVGRFHIVLF